jgi:hypothetical protein
VAEPPQGALRYVAAHAAQARRIRGAVSALARLPEPIATCQTGGFSQLTGSLEFLLIYGDVHLSSGQLVAHHVIYFDTTSSKITFCTYFIKIVAICKNYKPEFILNYHLTENAEMKSTNT